MIQIMLGENLCFVALLMKELEAPRGNTLTTFYSTHMTGAHGTFTLLLIMCIIGCGLILFTIQAYINDISKYLFYYFCYIYCQLICQQGLSTTQKWSFLID